MGKSKKKEKAKQKAEKAKHDAGSAAPKDPSLVIEELRLENEQLRSRLMQIAELARTSSEAKSLPRDVEDEEYEELSHDLDDQIAADRKTSEAVEASQDGRR